MGKIINICLFLKSFKSAAFIFLRVVFVEFEGADVEHVKIVDEGIGEDDQKSDEWPFMRVQIE